MENEEGNSNVILSSSIFWFLLSSWWFFNYKFINHQYTRPIHFILSFVLIFKTLNTIFSYFLAITSEKFYKKYFSLTQNSTYTIYNTFLYTAFLLISKGLNLTCNYLERNEIGLIALSMGIIYLGFSVYNINKTILKPILIIMLGVLWYSVYKNSAKVINNLSLRYDVMIVNSFRRAAKTIKAKLRIIKLFSYLANFLFVTQLICTFIDIFFIMTELENSGLCLTIFNAFIEIIHAIVVGGICVLYVPKSSVAFFEIEDFDNEDNICEVLPMYVAGIENQREEFSKNKPFVMIIPSNEEQNKNDQYGKILIAVPVVQKFTRPSLDELRENLLPVQIN